MRSFLSKKSIAIAALAGSSVLIAHHAQSQSTIASIYANGPGGYTVTGEVTGILDTYTSNNSFIITDGTGSIFAYHVPLGTYTATLGDNISLTATDVTYSGSPEFSTGYSVTINSSGNPIPANTLTIPQFNSAGDGSSTAIPPYAEELVTLDNVYLPTGTTTLANKTAYTLSDLPAGLGNTTTMYTYTTYSAVSAAVASANTMGAALSGPLNITGYVDVFYGKPEIYPTSIVQSVPEPSSCVLLGLGGIMVATVARRFGLTKSA